MTAQKLDAGLALNRVAKELTAWLEDTEVPAEQTMAEIGRIVDDWRGTNGQ